MADDPEETEGEEGKEGEDGEAKKGGFASLKKPLLLALLALIIIGLSVGGTLFALKILSDGPEVTGEEGEMAEGEEVVEVKKKAIYYPLKPSIIVNFDARGRQRFMQADITLLTRDADVISAIELHMPMIRNALVILIGGQLYEEVQTAEGKELMRIQCLEELQMILEKEIGKPGIEQVLFTNLVMQ
ncbi:MAG: flagellar basal body-associated protein FliL [Alteromonadaceae bacterium]|nr:MAG: flagellar basal body-associated protein FliL [Alteromonadaceae bacterium]